MSVTPQSWAQQLLASLGDPQSAANEQAIVSWEAAEGGNWHNTAAYNPLNTTQPEPGSQPMNSVGVQAYTSWQQGLQATVATLQNGNYPGILSALRQGSSAPAVEAAVTSSPWGTQSITNINPNAYTPSGGGGGILHALNPLNWPGNLAGVVSRNVVDPVTAGITGGFTSFGKTIVSWGARITVTGFGLAMIGVGLDRALTGGKGAASVKQQLSEAAPAAGGTAAAGGGAGLAEDLPMAAAA